MPTFRARGITPRNLARKPSASPPVPATASVTSARRTPAGSSSRSARSDASRGVGPERAGGLGRYSHSIVPGGFDVMSRTTRLTSRISLIMREAMRSSRS